MIDGDGMKKTVLVLGSTGSIGTQTLEVLKNLSDRFSVIGISADHDSEKLRSEAYAFRPQYVACREQADPSAYPEGTQLITGEDASEQLAAVPADITVLAISGFAALKPLLAAIRNGGRIAIANKESLVCGGELVKNALNQYGAHLVPIDSEQSALFQCLQNGRHCEVKRLILTASGGPFFRKSREELKNVSLDEALHHPTWKMGRKITLDSATLFNKGLEVIEASRLFDFGPESIGVLIHPQSIVHSLVEYKDNSVIANLAVPDMRLPIQYALTYPDRTESLTKPLDLGTAHDLEFYPADEKRFAALKLAFESLRTEGGCPIIFNGANERAAELFFNHEIGFLEIEDCVKAALDAYTPHSIETIEDIMETDAFSRRTVSKYAERLRK